MENVNTLIVILLWITLTISSAIICKKIFPSRLELSRKIVHIGCGPIIPLAWWLGISYEIACITSLIITIGLLINNQLNIIPSLENVGRKTFGTVAYGLSITFLIIFFWKTNIPALSAGVLTMAFGDGFAGLIGKNFKSPNWKILGQKKSILGTVSMFGITMILITVNSSMYGYNIDPMKIIILAIIGTGLEQISPLGVDNLTVPIGIAYGFKLLLN